MAIVTRGAWSSSIPEITRTDTRALLAHVQSVTRQPVRYVVAAQNHNDYSGGAALVSPPATTLVDDRVAKQWGRPAAVPARSATRWARSSNRNSG
jgi:hypothetical protein